MADAMEGAALPAPSASGVQALCKRTWWVFLIGGIAAVIFGILAFMKPGVALLVLASYFAAMVLVSGAVNIWGALSNRDKDGWWIMLLLGGLSVVAGGYALFHPALSMSAFVLLVAFTAIVIGFLLLTMGFKIRKESEREWVLYLSGALSVLFGMLIVLRPLEGSVSVVYFIAGWALLLGAMKIVFAFKVKNLPGNLGERLTAGD
jgi:uncharacterized membrane protein HdeD (DUF308 family)